MIGATNTRSGDAVRRTGDRYSAMARDARRTTQRDISQSSGKVRRNRLDWAKDRPNISLEPVAQNKSSANRVSRFAKTQGRIDKRTVPSNQGRYVSRSDRSQVVRTGRPVPVAGNRSNARVVNTLAYSSVKVANARPSPLPRQSQRPVSRSQASRPAPAASKPSPPPRSERGRSTSKGSRGQGHRDGHVRHR